MFFKCFTSVEEFSLRNHILRVEFFKVFQKFSKKMWLTISMDELTVEEKNIFDEFRLRAADIVRDEFLLAEDDLLLHYLLDAKFDLTIALDKIKLAFDTLWGLTEKAKNAEKLEVFHSRKYLPFGHCGYAKSGAMVWYARAGACDIDGLWKSAGREGLLTFFFQEWANILNDVKLDCQKSGKNRIRVSIIIDMDGFPVWVLKEFKYLKFIFELKKRFYKLLPLATMPCIEGVYLINNSALYKPIIEFAKYLAPENSIWAKVHIFGKNQSDWKEKILEKIDEDQIPRYWGGTHNGIDEFSGICQGGTVPRKYYLSKYD